LVARNAAQPVKVELRKRDRAKLAIGRDIPSKEEVQTMLAEADGRWRPLLITAIFTGMRSSALRGLTCADLDFQQKVIYVRQRADQDVRRADGQKARHYPDYCTSTGNPLRLGFGDIGLQCVTYVDKATELRVAGCPPVRYHSHNTPNYLVTCKIQK
jgi:integrase